MLKTNDKAVLKEKIIIALDCDREKALALADSLKGEAVWFKVGMTLFYREGPDIVKELRALGFKVFLDLKLHDIPHQVEGAAESAVLTGAEMITIHAAGGVDMMSAAKRGVEKAVQGRDGELPITLGITVLTSMNEKTLHDIGITNSLPDQVERLANMSAQANLSGVVASPHEAHMLRGQLGDKAYIVCPGVRPAGADKGDQSRVATPAQAIAEGASHIVVGRPIVQAPDPVEAFHDILAELENAFLG